MPEKEDKKLEDILRLIDLKGVFIEGDKAACVARQHLDHVTDE